MNSMSYLKGNIIASIDVETTGTKRDYHEIIQIAVVPLDAQLRPLRKAFCTRVRPNYPERMDPGAYRVHGISFEQLVDAPPPDKVADWLREYIQELGCKRVIPLCHNGRFEEGFLRVWLGDAEYDDLFHYLNRDAMVLALAMNDRAAHDGRTPPFKSVSLTSLCNDLKIVNSKPHDALHDALAEAEVYRTLCSL